MALDSSLVRVAVTGGVYVDLDGIATVPTSAVASVSSFDEVGYIGEEGITQAISTDITDIKAWQNGDTVRKVQTSHDVTYAFMLLETNPVALEVYYGNYTAGEVEVNGDQLPRLPWVLDVFDGDEKIRVTIPDGQVTERGDIVYANGSPIGYMVTITAYPDASGVKAYIYNGVLASS